jgi:hypothetical protein
MVYLHPHPPNLDSYALDIIEFWALIHKQLKIKGHFLAKNFQLFHLHPETKILATTLDIEVGKAACKIK